mmetsp:Transcript_111001/g.203553  ORF Transcript_111001/g.203553 Transcript_111001/m.203553 type:complete len:340 (-) Transcript_111001:2310-3329(-)
MDHALGTGQRSTLTVFNTALAVIYLRTIFVRTKQICVVLPMHVAFWARQQVAVSLRCATCFVIFWPTSPVLTEDVRCHDLRDVTIRAGVRVAHRQLITALLAVELAVGAGPRIFAVKVPSSKLDGVTLWASEGIAPAHHCTALQIAGFIAGRVVTQLVLGIVPVHEVFWTLHIRALSLLGHADVPILSLCTCRAQAFDLASIGLLRPARSSHHRVATSNSITTLFRILLVAQEARAMDLGMLKLLDVAARTGVGGANALLGAARVEVSLSALFVCAEHIGRVVSVRKTSWAFQGKTVSFMGATFVLVCFRTCEVLAPDHIRIQPGKEACGTHHGFAVRQ